MLPPAKYPHDFGRYRIVKLLGQGAMGSVYLARDTQLERDVALKVPQFAEGKEPQILARFYQEARAAATIHHPHVCPVYDVGEQEGTPYLTMAFIEGKPLEEWVASGKPLTQAQVATIGRKVADALGEAHKRGVIHRDLKPANIMIDKRGEPIVMDFGLAQRVRDDNTRLTRFGTVMGSPSYMSPEQIRGETQTTGPATDMFSLGVILNELLARRLPFDGDTVGAVHAQILMDEPPPLRDSCPDVAPALEAICMKALAKKAEDRYPTMAQMAAALKAYLTGSAPSHAGHPAVPAKPAAPVSPPPAKPAGSALHGSAFGGRSMVLAEQEEREAKRDKPKRKKKSKEKGKTPVWVWAAAGVAAVAVVVGLVLVLRPNPLQNTNQSPTTKSDDEIVKPRPTIPPMPNDPAFHPIFNGKDTTDWAAAWGPADIWRVDKGDLTFNTTKEACLLETTASFSDFVLRFEFQIGKGTDSALVVRTPPAGPKELIVKLVDHLPHLGMLWDWKATDHTPPLNPPDGWNWMEVELRGTSVRVSVNGAEVNKASLVDPAALKYYDGRPPLTKGRIGFQGLEGTARFRNIMLKEFPVKEAPSVTKEPEFHSLFDGKDFHTDWEVETKARADGWKVQNDALVSVGGFPNVKQPPPESWLVTKREYTDYELRFEFQVLGGGLSGIAPRVFPGQKVRLGIPVMDDAFPAFQALQDNTQTFYTGALRMVGIDKHADLKKSDEWNTMEIRVRGQHLRVTVNGKETLVTALDSDKVKAVSGGQAFPKSGKIALLNWLGTVSYRKIEIKDLTP